MITKINRNSWVKWLTAGVFSYLLPLTSYLFVSCEDKLDVSNPNQQTTSTFGNTAEDLEENVIAAYNHIRMEGTYARVGVLHHQRDKLYALSLWRR